MKVELKKNLLLDGVFTVNGNGKKVRFTRGNLYYDNTSCKVEQHQYDYNHKYYQAIHVSHFKWCHDLVNAVKMSYDANSEGQYTFFTEVEGFTVNGFDANQCHTLTIEELQYLFSDGSYNNDIRRGKYRSRVTVCGERNCVVLLPDNWEWGSNQDKQEYSYTEWKHMEDAGAVCLPAAGYRDEGEDEIKSTGLNGYYWTSSSEESPCAFCYVVEGYRGFVGRDYELRNSAYSVRLVTESK